MSSISRLRDRLREVAACGEIPLSQVALVPDVHLRVLQKESRALVTIISLVFPTLDALKPQECVHVFGSPDLVQQWQSEMSPLVIRDAYRIDKQFYCPVGKQEVNLVVTLFVVFGSIAPAVANSYGDSCNVMTMKAIVQLSSALSKETVDFDICAENVSLFRASVNVSTSTSTAGWLPTTTDSGQARAPHERQRLLDDQADERLRAAADPTTTAVNIHWVPIFVFTILACTLLGLACVLWAFRVSGVGDPQLTVSSNPIIIYVILVVMAAILSGFMWYRYQRHLDAVRGNRELTRSFFVNGWNAWSFCGVVRQGDEIPMYAMPDQLSKGFHHGSPALLVNQASRRALFHRYHSPYIASDMFTILADRQLRKGVVMGFLSQRKQFGYIATNLGYDMLEAHCDCDGIVLFSTSPAAPAKGQLETDWLFLHFQSDLEDEPLAAYMEVSSTVNGALQTSAFHIWQEEQQHQKSLQPSASSGEPEENRVASLRGVPTGWCSWYHFFSEITEQILLDNIASMKAVQETYHLHGDHQGFNLFQIDDGYQRAWGDWLQLDPKKFSSVEAMTSITTKIKQAGFLPGIWMAPFACDKHSLVAKEHPSWVLKRYGSSGQVPANSANCGKWFYGLDVTIPAVQAHVRHNVTSVVHDWGCKYLKLDFLYAAVLGEARGTHTDRTVSRAEILNNAMALIREAAGPGIFILGCGAPMGAVIGHVDANRVSADAGLCWYPEFPLPSYDKWNLPSARSMVQNSINRMSMHGRWWINDPDCMLLRRSTRFTDAEILGMATVKALSGGSFIISDDIASVPEDRVRIAQQMIPATNRSAVAVDLLERSMPELLRGSYLSRGNKIVIRQRDVPLIDEFNRRWGIVGVCNWSDTVAEGKIVHVSDFFGDPQFWLDVHSELVPSILSELTSSVHHQLPTTTAQSTYPPFSLCHQLKSEGILHGRGIASGGATNSLNVYFVVHLLDFWSQTYSYGLVEYNSWTRRVTRFQTLFRHNSDNSMDTNAIDTASTTLVPPSVHSSEPDMTIRFTGIPAHSSRLVAFRIHDVYGNLQHTASRQTPVYIGSNLHFSCGFELQLFEVIIDSGKGSALLQRSQSSMLRIVFKSGALKEERWQGWIWLFLPSHKSISEVSAKGASPNHHQQHQPGAIESELAQPPRSPTKICDVSDPVQGSHMLFGAVWKVPVCVHLQKVSAIRSDDQSNRELHIEWH